MKKDSQLKKNFIWNTIGTTLNAFNSLLFAIIVTRINGIYDAGIFTYSFATACILYVVGIYFGRTYQVTDISKENSDTDYIYNKIITSIFMIIISIVFCIIKRYDAYKSTIFILLSTFKAIEALSEVIYGIIQKKGKLEKVGKSFTIKAMVSLLVFVIVDTTTRNLIYSCISICIVNLFILFTYDLKNMKKLQITKTHFSFKKNNILLKMRILYFFTNTFIAIYYKLF